MIKIQSIQTLFELIKFQAAKNGDAPALLAPERTALSYSQVDNQVSTILHQLQQLGIHRQDRVLIVLPNGPAMAVILLAVSCAAISIPLNPGYTAVEFEFYLAELKPTAVILASGLDSPLRGLTQARGILLFEVAPVGESAGGLRLTLQSSVNADNPPVCAAPAQPTDIALILPTSGSTAYPKLIPLSHANLCASARQIGTSLGLTETDRCLNVMPLFHIHSIAGALLATIAAGSSIICTPGFDPETFFAWLATFQPTWYTAVPTVHQMILTQATQAATFSCPSLRLIRSSSAALAPTVMSALEQIFNVPVIEAYGMTEAAGQICSNPLPPGQRKAGSVGLAAGPAVAIMAEDSAALLPPGEYGEIVIRGASVMAGYLKQPAANQPALTQNWFRTGDRGYIDADGYLFISGRLKEQINRGGEKVAPREVDEVLLQHEAVIEAVTFGIPHPTLGEDVGAAVILKTGSTVTEQELRALAFSRLANYKVPTQIVIVPVIPKGASGKLQRIGLAEKLADQLGRTFVAPFSPLEQTVADIWSQVLAKAPIGMLDNFFALGGNSLLAMQVVTRIAHQLGVEILPSRLFAAPTLAALVQAIALTPTTSAATAYPTIPPRNPLDACQLSFAQQRLWFIHQLNPASPVYHLPKLFRFKGKLKQNAIQQALDSLVERHEVLRTVFPAVDGVPTQLIGPRRPIYIERYDLSEQTAAIREDVARDWVQRLIHKPFDLTTDLMVRAFLLQLTDDEQILLLVIHHSVADGWSMRVLERELAQLYTAICTNQPFALPDLRIQYADYSLWQRQWLTGERLATQLAYWQQQLANHPPLLDLPVDRPRAVRQTDHGAHEIQILEPALTDAIRAFSLRENVTLFMTLLAAFQILLYRYTGQDDLIVGTPLANRTPVETEPLIGFFVNTLALRGNLAGDPTVRELLDRVRRVALDAYDHGELPFEKLLEELKVTRDPSHHTLFQVMFALQNLPDVTNTWPDLTLAPFKIDKGTAPFDLYMTIGDSKGDLKVTLYYKTDLFDRSTISRMLGHFIRLLTAVVAQEPLGALQRLSQLPLLTEVERRQLFIEWNATQQPTDQAVYVHHLFEAHCQRSPDQAALIYRDTQLTYQQLNQRANQLAHYLHQQGVGPAPNGSPLVAICLERTPEAAIAMLAVLKAGGAFICLNPTWPAVRLAAILQQTQVKRLITRQGISEKLPNVELIKIDLDTDQSIICQARQDNPNPGLGPEDLAYVVCTSGSTGAPKCVMAPHRAITNYVIFCAQTFAISNTDRTLQFSSMGSEPFIADILTYLAQGATVVLRPEDEVLGVQEFLRFLDDQQISSVLLPTAYWQQWALALADPQTPLPTKLRLVMTGMDVVQPKPFALWQARIGKAVRWVNIYGPAETTIGSTYYEADFSRAELPTRIPIGRPIHNTSIYLLDATLKPVPIGVTGEIYIGGAGVTHGYLNQPEQTAEKFIPNPYGAGRLYKTGDLARYLPDGNLLFLGRKDHQVKIRGFRVELQEIEQRLHQHPTIQEAVVVAYVQGGEQNADDKQLVAYVVPVAGEAIQAEALHQFLKQALPAYMIPQSFVPLAALPLTPTGKLDRLALPAPTLDRAAVNACFVAPSNALEERVATLWRETLGLKIVGIHDNFFELGGHSLTAVRIVGRIRTLFKLEFPLAKLFEAPTIAEMALAITQLYAQQVALATVEELLTSVEALSEGQAQLMSQQVRQ